MSDSLTKEFGRFRSFFWPIHSHEFKKLLPMVIMVFFVCFNYSMLRNMKDSVVITAAGAEVIPFIKVYTLLPAAVIVTLLFAKLSDKFSQEKVFYIIISSFLLFFALFAFVFYPMNQALHCDRFADFLQTLLPGGCKGLIGMIRYWSFTAFYVISELWGSLVLSVLFWGFANEITRVHEAKRFYSVLGISSNFAAMVAGFLGKYFSYGEGLWLQTMQSLILLIVASGILVMLVFYWMNRNVLNSSEFDELRLKKLEMKKKRQRMTIKDSLSFLSSSKYLLCIAVIVVAYNLGMNLVELVWKDRLKALYPAASDYNEYISSVLIWTGLISTITALFMARIINTFGWTATAMITPVIMLVTSFGFFGFLYLEKIDSTFLYGLIGVSPMFVAVFFGSLQNCLSKAAKYSVFDTTKEMAFIPLEHEVKLKGKAAIDGVGSRLGKSGGSFIHQGFLMIFVTYAQAADYIGVLLIALSVIWTIAVKVLGKEFSLLVEDEGSKEKAKEETLSTIPA